MRIDENAKHTASCTPYTCFERNLDFADSPSEFEHFHVWLRGAAARGTRNLCLKGLAEGVRMYGDPDREFGIGRRL